MDTVNKTDDKWARKRELANARMRRYRERRREVLARNKPVVDEIDNTRKQQIEDEKAQRKRELARERSRRYLERKRINALKTVENLSRVSQTPGASHASPPLQYDVSLTNNAITSFGQSSNPYENNVCTVSAQTAEDMHNIDKIKEEPCLSSKDIIEDNCTRLQCYVPKTVKIKEEHCQSSGDNEEKDPSVQHSVLKIEVEVDIKEEPFQPPEDVDDNGTSLQHNVLKTVYIKEEPRESSEDVMNDSGTSLHCNVPNTVYIKVEPCPSSEDFSDDNDTSLQYNVTKREDIKGGFLSKEKPEQPDEMNTSEENSELSQRIEENISKNNLSDSKKQNSVNKSDKVYYCDTCEQKYKSKSALTLHQRTHAGEKPFSCDICSYKCTRMSYLKVHLRTHTGEKPFSCNICSYKCNDKSNLKPHLRTHTGEKPFSCDICLYKFKNKSSLKRHLKMHNDKYCGL